MQYSFQLCTGAVNRYLKLVQTQVTAQFQQSHCPEETRMPSNITHSSPLMGVSIDNWRNLAPSHAVATPTSSVPARAQRIELERRDRFGRFGGR